MKINLEIIDCAYLYGKEKIENLNTKTLVPKMMFRRRLTQASKIAIELIDKVNFKNGRILYGTSYGELKATASILNDILNTGTVSPTDFQNSVYNTAISYSSIFHKNTNELLTISSGDETSLKVLKAGAIKALDGDELLLICCETINIQGIEEVNKCVDFLECAVALKVKISKEESTLSIKNIENNKFPKSMKEFVFIAQNFDKNKKNILEIEL